MLFLPKRIAASGTSNYLVIAVVYWRFQRTTDTDLTSLRSAMHSRAKCAKFPRLFLLEFMDDKWMAVRALAAY